MIPLGDYVSGDTVYVPFHTFSSDDPAASVTTTGLAVTDIEVYKNGSTTQRSSDAGYTLLDTDGIDFDGITGLHGFSIDTSDNTDAGFYAANAVYWIAVSTITVDGGVLSFWAGFFTIEKSGGVATILTDTEAVLADSEAVLTDTEGSGAIASILVDTEASQVTEASLVTDTEAIILDTEAALTNQTTILVDTEASQVAEAAILVDTEAILSDTEGLAAGSGLTPLASGTAQGGTSTTIQLAAGETFGNDILNGNTVKITSGTGAGQSRVITDYVGTSDTATVFPAWTTTPSTDSVYEVVDGSANVVSVGLTSQTAGDIVSDTEALLVDTEASQTTESTILADTELVLADTESSQLNEASILSDTETSQVNEVAILTDTEGLNTTTASILTDTEAILADTEGLSAGSGLTPLASGTAQGGTTNTIQLAVGETFGNDILNGAVVKITSGTGAGQSRLITDYVGATDTATVAPSWITTPSTDSVYEIVEGQANVVAVGGTVQTAGDIIADTEASQVSEAAILADSEAIVTDTEAVLTDAEAAITERATLLTDTEALLVDTEASQIAEAAILSDTEASQSSEALLLTDTEAILTDSEASQLTEAAILVDTEASQNSETAILADTEASQISEAAILSDTEASQISEAAILVDTEASQLTEAAILVDTEGISASDATAANQLLILADTEAMIADAEAIIADSEAILADTEGLAGGGNTYNISTEGTNIVSDND